MNNIMLDIKTLGKSPDSSIFAIECVFFEPSTGKIGKQYYRAVDLRSTTNIPPEAVIELLKGDARERAEVVSATCGEIFAITGLFDFIKKNSPENESLHCWSAGYTHSSIKLLHAASRHHLGALFPEMNIRCLSTLVQLAGVTGYVPHPRLVSAIYTITNAVYRAEQVCEIWQRLTSPHLESL